MSKRKALGGDASDEEYAAFPYVISGMEREIRALKRQVQRLEKENEGLRSTEGYEVYYIYDVTHGQFQHARRNANYYGGGWGTSLDEARSMCLHCLREHSSANPHMIVSIFNKRESYPVEDPRSDDARPVAVYSANTETREFVVMGEDVYHYGDVQVMDLE